MKPKMVLDTNVFIKALLNPTGGAMFLVRLAQRKQFDLYTSREQIAELVGVVRQYFSNPRERSYISDVEMQQFLKLVFSSATLVPSKRMNKVSPDADDDYIIGIAIKAKANHLITEDQKHIYQSLTPQNPPITVLNIRQAVKLLNPKERTRKKH